MSVYPVSVDDDYLSLIVAGYFLKKEIAGRILNFWLERCFISKPALCYFVKIRTKATDSTFSTGKMKYFLAGGAFSVKISYKEL